MTGSGSSSATCPNGHTSGDPEWCDTCGAPMPGTAPAARPAAAGTAGPDQAIAPVSCPNCSAINSADNLFCESCGYDFTTGQAPVSSSVTPPPSRDPAAGGSGAGSSMPAPVAGVWVVVVEVDPAWFALRGELADRPLPEPSTSTVPLAQHVSLVGRTSQSRGVRPEVALDADTAVSRRHAQFLLEGDRLSIVDLTSTNGTHVVDRGVVPTDDVAPLVSGVPAVLDDGDQVFLGAWTRLTVRRTQHER